MSYVKINIADRNETISGEVHGSEGDALVAALSAEPETIAELGHALSRFINPHGAESPFARFFRHEDYEPYDAGILIIDLAARVVAQVPKDAVEARDADGAGYGRERAAVARIQVAVH